MTNHDDTIALRQMLDHAKRIRRLLSGYEKSAFEHDERSYFAILHLLAIVGEAANCVQPETRERYPEVPWRALVGMRNRIIHGYDVVDVDIIWDTVSNDIPDLIDHLEKGG
jgi:uncharacterized protein with HEPN domain